MDKRLKKNLLFSFVISIIGLSYHLIIKNTFIRIPCMFHQITGLYCPGCGVTRMFEFLLKLDFGNAFKSNQAAFIFLPFGVFLYLKYSYLYIRDGQWSFSKIDNTVLIIFVIFLIVFGVIRNFPGLSFLTPN